MGAEIFAEAETGTRYGFISRSGPKRKGEGEEGREKGGGGKNREKGGEKERP